MAPNRSTGIIHKDSRILMIFRRKNGEQYYAFPGGRPEEYETPETTVEREVKEETGLAVTKSDYLFSVEEDYRGEKRKNFHYYCEVEDGIPQMSGPEIETISETNYYEPKWITFDQLKTAKIKADPESIRRVFEYLNIN